MKRIKQAIRILILLTMIMSFSNITYAYSNVVGYDMNGLPFFIDEEDIGPVMEEVEDGPVMPEIITCETVSQVTTEIATVEVTTEITTIVLKNETTTQKSVTQNTSKVANNKLFKGKFKLTFYTASSFARTATGTVCKEGVTIAVDPKVIPLGSKVHIDGWGTYIAQDTGGVIHGNIIDIYLSNYDRCIQNGIKYANVWVEKK